MKHTVIPAGYRLTVVSWENDRDNYNTEVIEGLSKPKCALYVDLCKALKNDAFDSDDRLCNMYDPSEKEIEKVTLTLQEIINSHNIDEDEDEDEIDPIEYLSDLGLSGQSEYLTRVCDSFNVEYLPHDIIMEDVTDQFDNS